MLFLQPSLSLICKASFNPSNELVVSEEILELGSNDELSVRYLTRIREDEYCSVEGMVSRRAIYPDRIERYLSPAVATQRASRICGFVPIVSLDKSPKSVFGGGKRTIMNLDPTVKSSCRRHCLKHQKTINAHVKGRLGGIMYLFTYVLPPSCDGKLRFARIPIHRLDELVLRLGDSCLVEIYNSALECFAAEDIYLRVYSIGMGMSMVADPNLPDGHVNETEILNPEDATGSFTATWVPVTNAVTKQEHPEAELDKMVNDGELIQVINETCRGMNDPCNLADSSGINQHIQSSSVSVWFSSLCCHDSLN